MSASFVGASFVAAAIGRAEERVRAFDLAQDVGVRSRGSRIDRPLDAVDEVTGDDRVAVAVLEPVLQGEGQGLGVRRHGRQGLGQRRNDLEVLVEVDEAAVGGAWRTAIEVESCALFGSRVGGLLAKVDLEDLISGEVGGARGRRSRPGPRTAPGAVEVPAQAAPTRWWHRRMPPR